MNPKLMTLAMFMMVAASLVSIGRLMFGDEWDRLRPIMTGLLGAVIFLFVFAASYRGIVKNRSSSADGRHS